MKQKTNNKNFNLQMLLDIMGENFTYLSMMLFALPFLLPLPYGEIFKFVLGLPLFLIAIECVGPAEIVFQSVAVPI